MVIRGAKRGDDSGDHGSVVCDVLLILALSFYRVHSRDIIYIDFCKRGVPISILST